MNSFQYISNVARYILHVTRSTMDGLTIHIGWEYFLGLMAGLLAVAWYSSARFTALETSMKWVKETLAEIKVNSDNASRPAFGPGSPIDLKPIGIDWLNASGLREYIDSNKEVLIAGCEDKRSSNPYEVQKRAFLLFDTFKFPDEIEDRLKKFAFEKGTTMAIMRRVGGIYFRNLCLDAFDMKKEDIDTHEQANQQ